MTDADKRVFNVIAGAFAFSTLLLIILCVSSKCISIIDVINAYGIPIGLLAGWAIIVLIEEKKK